MAKLNWQKLHIESKAQTNNRVANQEDWRRKHKNTWLLGKHYGKKINELSTKYLIWASENLPEGNVHKSKADVELIRRYKAQK